MLPLLLFGSISWRHGEVNRRETTRNRSIEGVCGGEALPGGGGGVVDCEAGNHEDQSRNHRGDESDLGSGSWDSLASPVGSCLLMPESLVSVLLFKAADSAS